MSDEERVKSIMAIYKVVEMMADGEHETEIEALTLVSNNLFLELPEKVADSFTNWLAAKMEQQMKREGRVLL